MPFITFGSLSEGSFFIARQGAFFVKEKPALPLRLLRDADKTLNAFYYTDQGGKFVHFEDITLVQEYDETKHGLRAEIMALRQRALEKHISPQST